MSTIIKIEKIETPEEVYDPVCDFPHAYISDGFVSHNCVLLLDEVEKIFGASGSDDAGVTTRILSQLLWWLAEHQGQVLTIMTTNNMSKLPPELYRSGRVDLCMKIPRLTPTEAMSFARKVFINIMGQDANLAQQSAINTMFKLLGKDDYAHAEVSDLVADEIKKNGWFSLA